MQELSLSPEAGTAPVGGGADVAGAAVEPVVVEQAPSRKFGIGAWLASIWLVGLAIAALIVPFTSLTTNPKYPNLADVGPFKSGAHIFGVDAIGRDQLSLLLWGARSSLILGVGAIAIGMIVGGFLGLAAGYIGGRTDTLIAGVFNVLLAIPQLVLALALVTALSNDQPHISGTSVSFTPVSPARRLIVLIIALGIVSIPVLGRITRANALTWAQREFVLAARAQGAKSLSIMIREVLPNVLPAMFSIALLGVGVVIVAEGGLAVLGVGVHDPSVSWGVLIAGNRSAISTGYAYLLMEPVVFIFLTVLSLNYLGDVIRARFEFRDSAL
ncbi:MAG TPA: ABC transporter permease [Acidimicrobiia bacterium]